MRTLARVGVFEKVSTVKLREAVRVAREVRGSPVEKHADIFLVTAIDEIHEIRGRAEAAGGSVVAERLVTPGAVEGVLHDGEKLDVGVAELFDIRDELFGEFAIGEPAIVIFGDASPGAEVDFVN